MKIKKYPWWKPIYLSKSYIKLLSKVVKNKKLTTGDQTQKVENYLKKFLNVKHVVLTTSGTSALMMATMAASIKPKNIVLSTNFTWVATTNPSKIMNADVKLVDTEPYSEKVCFKTLNKKIIKYKPKLVFLVHLNGQATYNKKFNELKKKYKFFVIEDAAQSILSKTDSKNPCGTHYDIGCYSLSITKHINMIYGGFCTTNSDKLAKKLIAIRNNGLKSQEWFLKWELASMIGLNLKPSDLHSAIGLINLQKRKFVEKNLLDIYNYYKKNLKNPKIRLENIEGKFSVPCYAQAFVKNVKEFINYCAKRKIGVHTGLRCISETEPFAGKKEKFPNSIFLSKHLVRLPSGPGYKVKEIAKIVNILNKY